MKALRLHRELDAIWRSLPGWRGTLATVNHSDIGRRLILTAFAFFAIGGILAMLIRAQLATPRSAFAGPEIYSQLFTMHGSIMMFLFAIPMFEGLAMYLLPKMLGARDLAFPRLSAYGWWCYVFGGSLLILSLLLGIAPDSGWFMYTPLSSRPYSPGINSDVWLLGITFVEISAICAAIEIAVSILRVRAPGMSLDRMPLFAWYLLATALMMLVGFPPLILGSILLEVERAFGWPFFDTTRGGDPLLWQHLFWLFGHPEVYIIFLPAAGAISTILPVMARTPILGYRMIVAAVLALAFLSFGLWVHHMFAVGIPHMALAFFSAASTLVAVPTAVQLFAWIGTLWSGRPQMTLPMLYLIGFFVTFVMGGLTGVMVAVVPFDWQAHDTAFVTAHLHYVLVGGFVFPMLAAAYYWLPHFTGRQRSFQLGEMAFWLIFLGFHLTFFLLHLAGLLGQVRRIETYPEAAGWTWINLISSFGSFVMAFGFALFTIDIALQIFLARKARRNPWRAGTLEWAMITPPPSYNIASLPHVNDRDPLEGEPDLPNALARGEGYLGEARHGWRETMAVDLTGRIAHIVVLPGNSVLPILTAAVTGGFFVAMLLGLYWLAPIALAGIAVLGWRWAWQTGRQHIMGPLPVGRGETALTQAEVPDPLGWTGSQFLLLADAMLFASLLFGQIFLWAVAPSWIAPPSSAGSWLILLMTGLGGMAVLGPGFWRAKDPTVTMAGLIVLAMAMSAGQWRAPAPTDSAYGAVTAMMTGYALFHILLALLITLFVRARTKAGYVDEARQAEPRVARLWRDFAAVATIIACVAIQSPVLG